MYGNHLHTSSQVAFTVVNGKISMTIQYKLEYSIVHPICSGCHLEGLKPAVCNALKVVKKRKH